MTQTDCYKLIIKASILETPLQLLFSLLNLLLEHNRKHMQVFYFKDTPIRSGFRNDYLMYTQKPRK